MAFSARCSSALLGGFAQELKLLSQFRAIVLHRLIVKLLLPNRSLCNTHRESARKKISISSQICSSRWARTSRSRRMPWRLTSAASQVSSIWPINFSGKTKRRHCQRKVARTEFSTDDRELGRPELTPLGECGGAVELEIVS